MNKADTNEVMDPSQRITNHITELADWRGEMIAHLRELVLEAEPNITEEWKWGSPVWSHHGLVCSTGTFKNHVKFIFFKGASLEDKHGLINAGKDAKEMRSIDFKKGDTLNETALKELIRSAIAYNLSGSQKE